MISQLQRIAAARFNIRTVNKSVEYVQRLNVHKTAIALKNLNEASSSEGISNEPVQFFGSQAASWRAKDTRSGGSDESLWFQPYVISGSLAVFMLYFFILREESDIDKRLEGNLFDQVSGLEEMSLAVKYKYNKENGLDTRELEERLTALGVNVKELEMQRLQEHGK